MRTGAIICLVIFVVAALMSLLQLWFNIFDWGFFVKFLITLGVTFTIVLAGALVKREYVETKKMQDEGFLD